MPGTKATISKRAQQIFLVSVAVLLGAMFMAAWPRRLLSLRQYFPQEITMRWFTSFSSLSTTSNLTAAAYYNNMGVEDMNAGRLDQALVNYNKAIALNTDSGFPYYYLSVLECRLKQYAKAGVHARKAQELGVDVDPAFLEMIKSNGGFS